MHTAPATPGDTNPPGRLWAIGVLVLAAVVSISMNTWHAFTATSLPEPLAFLYGVGPVALAAMQSHAVALRALRQEQVGWFRRGLTFGLVAAGLGLSFLGIYDLLQAAVPDPITSTTFNEPAILFPITVDLMALAALHELLRLTPSLVTAPQPTASDAGNHAPAQPPQKPAEEPETLHEPAPETGPDRAPSWPDLPVLGPLIKLPSREPVSATVAASNGHPVTVVERVPDEGADDRPKAPRRSTEEERERAREMYRRSVAYGSPMTQEELGERFGWSRAWGRDRIAEVNAETSQDGTPDGGESR
jgi:hypothetical protein